MKDQNSRSGWQIFKWPLLLAAVSLIGLLSALLGDGWADAVSWLSLGGVLATLLVAYCRG